MVSTEVANVLPEGCLSTVVGLFCGASRGVLLPCKVEWESIECACQAKANEETTEKHQQKGALSKTVAGEILFGCLVNNAGMSEAICPFVDSVVGR